MGPSHRRNGLTLIGTMLNELERRDFQTRPHDHVPPAEWPPVIIIERI